VGTSPCAEARCWRPAIAACIACAPAIAADLDETWARRVDIINPYASIGYGYDSNLFRIDDETPVIEGRSDQFAMISAGFDADIEDRLQRYELSGVVSHSMYDTYDEVDHTAGRALAMWHWDTGAARTGTLGYKYRRSLRDFANQSRFDKIIDIRTEHQLAGSADFGLRDNWKLGVRADIADVSFSSTEALDLLRTTAGARVSYVSGAGNSIGMDAEFINGDYDNNPASEFEEYTIGPVLEWQLTSRMKLHGTIGYTNRDFSEPARSDYDDVTGRIALISAESGRSRLTATVWRDISNLSDEIAEFALINGISIEPSWQFANGLGLRLNAAYENRDFEADVAGGDREDDIYTAGVFADWGLTANIKLSAGVDFQERSSSRELQDYDFNKVVLQITGSL
jgi:hypothetical protein